MGSAVSNERVARDEESRHEAQRCSPAVAEAARICLDSDMPLPTWLKDQALRATDNRPASFCGVARPATFCGVATQPEQEKVRRLSDFLGDHTRSQSAQSDVFVAALIPTSPLGLLAKELAKTMEMGTCDKARPEHAGSSALEMAPAVAMTASPCHSEAGEEASLVEAASETASTPLADVADELAPPRTLRRRAATDGNLDASIESDSEEDASPRRGRERASTECCMVHLLSESLARDMSDSEQAAPSSPEWDADWSTISAQLQPQCYKIGESRAALATLRSQRVQVARRKRQNLVVRLASQAEMIEGTEDRAPRHRNRTGSDFASECCQVGRTRARTMSGGFPTARRSQRLRRRANTNTGGVYDLDWAALAALEV